MQLQKVDMCMQKVDLSQYHVITLLATRLIATTTQGRQKVRLVCQFVASLADWPPGFDVFQCKLFKVAILAPWNAQLYKQFCCGLGVSVEYLGSCRLECFSHFRTRVAHLCVSLVFVYFKLFCYG